MEALIVVDVQKCFLNEHSRHIVPKIKDYIIKKRQKVYFTRFTNSKRSPFYKAGFTDGLSKEDIRLPKEFDDLIDHNVYDKTSFSALKNKKLLSRLKKDKLTKLVICGTDTECCVYATAMEAFELGFDVKVPDDLCASHNGKRDHKIGIKLIRENLNLI